MKAFKMAQPKTLAGAHSVLKGSFDSTKIMAGGTDLIAMMKDGAAAPDLVVNVKGVEKMRWMEKTDRGLEIGALITMTELAELEGVSKDYPAIRATILRSATPQVRNAATIAGNLCQRPRCVYFRHESYSCLKNGGKTCPAKEGAHENHAIFNNDLCNAPHVSNLAPVFIAYEAEIDIAGPKGTRTVKAEEFFTGPEKQVMAENILKADEVVTAIILPKNSARKNSAYVEARQKQSYDWALTGATVAIELDGDKVKSSRIVLSAIAPTPLRRRDLEKMIEGKRLTESRIKDVAEAAVKNATPLRDNAYKTIMLKAVLSRAMRQAKEA
ncbi:MAG: FAD binding domain-containing protein [Planctomycetota bacterium]